MPVRNTRRSQVATRRGTAGRIVREALRAGERRAARRTAEARRARTTPATALAYARHLDAQLTRAAPIMRQAYQAAWWANVTPRDVGAIWEVTAGWAAAGEGYAQATLMHLREQTSRRYGITVRELRLQDRDVLELLTRVRGANTPAAHSRTPANRPTP